MALVNKLPSISSSSSSSSPQFRKPNSFNFNPICSVHYTSSSFSPFTEKHSIERYRRDNWLFKDQLDQPISCQLSSDPDSIRDYDIALQLPELKRLLEILREKRGSGGPGGEGGSGPGNVFLVGTGPGDPELLTLKAVRVIQSADLLLYDRLVSNEVLNLVGPDARLLYVGKTAGYHSRTQVCIDIYVFLYVYICFVLYYVSFCQVSISISPILQKTFINLDCWFASFLILDSDFVILFCK